ncbi:General transcription factor IIH subunit 2 [Didymella keratinophila]|nr:General transcription factor IIH subunit 2 [Didymella keratinophila]
MAAFSHLIRFEADDGKTYYGDLTKETPTREIQGKEVEVLEGDIKSGFSKKGSKAKVSKLLCPLPTTNIILCVGLNYRQHAEECNLTIPSNPAIFMKPSDALAGPLDTIPIHADCQSALDYEGELTIIIGKDCKNATASNWSDYILGYTVGNDVSARNFQLPASVSGGQFGYAKSFDKFAPIGPCIAAKEVIGDPQKLTYWTKVNGQKRQETRTDDMIFGVAEIVQHLSRGTTLRAGTAILTGTPSGVGLFMEPKGFVGDGDEVEIYVEGIGSIVNKMQFELCTHNIQIKPIMSSEQPDASTSSDTQQKERQYPLKDLRNDQEEDIDGPATKEEEIERHNDLYNQLKARMQRAKTRHREDLQKARTTVSSMATPDDGDASARWQALKAAKIPEAEIEWYKMLQSTPRTKAEAEHDKDLHELRMRRLLTNGSQDQDAVREVASALRAEQASSQTQRPTPEQEDSDLALALQLQEEEYRHREVEQRQASSIEEEAQILRYKELQLEKQNERLENLRDGMLRTLRSAGVLPSMAQQSDLDAQDIVSPRPRRGRGRGFEQNAPPSPPPSDTPETSRPPLVIPFSSGHVTIPSLKRSDAEVFKVPAKPPSPPPKTQWRDRTRQRGRLNLDFSRIDARFLLTHQFIDDVNSMLDVIDGWTYDRIKDIEYAFKKDVDNRGRTIEFVKIDIRRWGVRLLNPANPERRDSLGMLCPFRSSDNPDNICQNLGSKYCSNKAYTEERTASLRSFRDQQHMPPPSLPPRSDKRKVPSMPPAKLSPPVNILRPPESPLPELLSFPEKEFRPERIGNVELGGSKIGIQVEQVKSFMSQIKTQSEVTQDAQAEGRDRVRQFLKSLNVTPSPFKQSIGLDQPGGLQHPRRAATSERPGASEQPESSEQPKTSVQRIHPEQMETSEQAVRHHPDDNASCDPTPGKLVHREKIPTGPRSLRREDLFFTSAIDARGVHPYRPWAEAVHDKPREQYFTAANTVPDESSSENDTSSASSFQEQERPSIGSTIQSAIANNKPKPSFCPQYLQHPDAY